MVGSSASFPFEFFAPFVDTPSLLHVPSRIRHLLLGREILGEADAAGGSAARTE